MHLLRMHFFCTFERRASHLSNLTVNQRRFVDRFFSCLPFPPFSLLPFPSSPVHSQTSQRSLFRHFLHASHRISIFVPLALLLSSSGTYPLLIVVSSFLFIFTPTPYHLYCTCVLAIVLKARCISWRHSGPTWLLFSPPGYCRPVRLLLLIVVLLILSLFSLPLTTFIVLASFSVFERPVVLRCVIPVRSDCRSCLGQCRCCVLRVLTALFAPAWPCLKEPPSPGVNHDVHSGSASDDTGSSAPTFASYRSLRLHSIWPEDLSLVD